MKIRTTRYIIKEGILNVYRNKLMSVASISVVTVSLIILGILLLVTINFNYNTEALKKQPEMEIFCDYMLDDAQVQVIEEKIKNNIMINDYKMITKKEAFLKVKEFLEGKEDILEGINEDFLPVSFKVNLINLEDTKRVVNELESIKGVSKVRYSQKEIELIFKITYWTRLVSIILISILITSSIFIISNTIKLTVFARRKEIGIMKYIGATDWFIRWPFIVEGIIIGLIGAIFSFVIVGYSYSLSLNNLVQNMKIIKFIRISDIGINILIIYLLSGAFVGAVGSYISIRKYLRV